MRSVSRATLANLTLISAAFVSMTLPSFAQASEEGFRLLELEGYKLKWGDRRLGAGASISYAFASRNLHFDEARNCRELAPVETLFTDNLSRQTITRETAAAFRVWERAAGLSFHQVSDTRDADIIIGAQGKPKGMAFANVSYTSEAEADVRSINQALVCLNPQHKWKVGFDGNEEVYDIRYTLIHEIGHTIGLDHPGRSGQVMAFRYTEAFDDLQPGDMAGVRLLYGHAADDEQINIAVTQTEQKPTEVYQVNNLNSQSTNHTAESELAVLNIREEAKP